MYSAPTLETLMGFNMGVALPALTLAFGTMIVLMVGLFLPEERKRWLPVLSLSLVSASFIMTLFTFNPDNPVAFGGMYVGDSFTNFVNLTVLATLFISILLSTDYLRVTQINHSEYYSLILLSASGVMFMAGANNLIMVFIALELLSIPLYVLAAFRSTDGTPNDEVSTKSEESGIKYFILGAFASAFFVYGAALIYGATGSADLHKIFASVQLMVISTETTSAQVLLLLGAALIVVGLGFKVAAVPFHMWTPDVYEGSPTPVTGFMSVAAKIGGFAALLRILVVGLSAFTLKTGEPAAWQNAIQVIAALTLILGNAVALSQSNVKRMLAYSSIAHAGYILMALAAVGSSSLVMGLGNTAAQSVLVYLLAYMFTNLGAFAVVMTLEKEDGTGMSLDDFNGLYNTRPGMAIAMAVFMFSLTGIPLTAGFMGKWLVFSATIQAGLVPLAVIGVLTSVISAFYYMRVIRNMFQNQQPDGLELPPVTPSVNWAVYASMVGVILLGIFPVLITNLIGMVKLV
jgi:NADH-quinone oxidoreductase subunit N